jgi:adenine deaminase
LSASDVQERRAAAEVAMGNEAPSMLLRGGRLVDVHTGGIVEGDVALAGRRIACVGDAAGGVDSSTEILDCSGLFIVPGFIDAHLHIGGSQLTIERLAEVMVPRGTAAICTDFYEPAVVAGAEAVEELLERAEGTGLAILLSPFHAAALGFGEFGDLGRFVLDDLRDLLDHEACVEIREWNYWVNGIPLPGISSYYEAAVERKLVVSGHLEGLLGPELQASVALGVGSDHEAATPEEALEKVRSGVIVQVREGSGARDLRQLLKAVTEHDADPRSFALCSDEQELASLGQDGHMDHKLRLAVREGVAPIDAIRMATLNIAQYLRIDADYGSLAPGRVASLALVENLEDFPVRLVVSEGRLSAEDGTYMLAPDRRPYPEEWRNTVHLDGPVSPETFLIDAPDGADRRLRLIGVREGSLLTEEIVEPVPLEGGRLADRAVDVAKIAVIDRHEGGRRVGLGLIRGTGIEQGAFATTVNPGLMNLMVVGTNEEDMAVAANRVAELGGGMAVVRGQAILTDVALPVFGILSDAAAAETTKRCAAVKEELSKLGSPISGLLTTTGFACLAVSIPSLKICDRGLVRVSRNGQEGVELVADEEPARP